MSEEKEVTRPWEANESPWKRDVFRFKKRKPGFRPRFVTQHNVQERLKEGWTVAKGEDWGFAQVIIGDEAKNDPAFAPLRKGMVLMEIPEELAVSREKFYAEKAEKYDRAFKQKGEFTRDAEAAGIADFDPAKKRFRSEKVVYSDEDN